MEKARKRKNYVPKAMTIALTCPRCGRAEWKKYARSNYYTCTYCRTEALLGEMTATATKVDGSVELVWDTI